MTIFKRFRLRDITLNNQIGLAPMCQYSASKDGMATDWHLIHLGSIANGGVGLIIVEATSVSPEGRVTPQDLGIWDDAHIAKLKKIASEIEWRGSVPGIQLSHAGRKGSRSLPWSGDSAIDINQGGWDIMGPSAQAFAKEYSIPIEMTCADIQLVTSQFKEATKRVLQAGFKFIEVHAAHGRLFHSYLSPLSNHRTDQYGGSFENRCRFLVEVIGVIRSVWPDNLPLGVRLSCVDWVESGWDIDDTVRLCSVLKKNGVDVIDCTSGGIQRPIKVNPYPGYQAGFSREVRSKVGISTMAVGLINSFDMVQRILKDGDADIVLLGRQLLRSPHWLLEREGISTIPPQYEKGYRFKSAKTDHIPEL